LHRIRISGVSSKAAGDCMSFVNNVLKFPAMVRKVEK